MLCFHSLFKALRTVSFLTLLAYLVASSLSLSLSLVIMTGGVMNPLYPVSSAFASSSSANQMTTTPLTSNLLSYKFTRTKIIQRKCGKLGGGRSRFPLNLHFRICCQSQVILERPLLNPMHHYCNTFFLKWSCLYVRFSSFHSSLFSCFFPKEHTGKKKFVSWELRISIGHEVKIPAP